MNLYDYSVIWNHDDMASNAIELRWYGGNSILFLDISTKEELEAQSFANGMSYEKFHLMAREFFANPKRYAKDHSLYLFEARSD